MLVNYTVDVAEEELGPEALALRKRLARRHLESAIQEGAVDEGLLVKLKKRSLEEVKQQRESNQDVYRVEGALRETEERASQQLTIERNLYQLDHDLRRSATLSRSRIDALSDLEKRVARMKAFLRDSTGQGPSVVELVGYELRTNPTQKLDKMFTMCHRCSRKILSSLFDAHDASCAKLGGKTTSAVVVHRAAVYDIKEDDDNDITYATTSAPQCPRHFRVVAKGCTFIKFEWDPPIFDGGLPLYDHEIEYNQQIDTFDKKTKLWVRNTVRMPTITTTQYCFKRPGASHGFKINLLTAGCTYVDFRIRCLNLRGASPYCLLEGDDTTIRMDEPEAPSAPLFFELDKVTSSCIHIHWAAPFYDGGVPINDYYISYTVHERVFLAHKKDHVVPRNISVKVRSAETSFVLRNLPNDVLVTDIGVCAVNTANQVGDKAFLSEPVVTEKGSVYKQYLFEIRRIEALSSEFVDTDFYNDITQRLRREELLHRLRHEHSIIPVDPSEEEEQKIWDTLQAARAERLEAERLAAEEEARVAEEMDVSGDEGNDDASHAGQHDAGFPFHIRKKHYKRKIKRLEDSIATLETERKGIDANRVKLTLFLKEKQTYVMSLNNEKSRLKNFQAPMISSSLLHGTPMNYHLEDFKRDLEVTFNKTMALMTKAKNDIITGEKRKAEIKASQGNLSHELKERKAAFNLFIKRHDAIMNTMNNIRNLQGSNTQSLSHFFHRLVAFLNYRRRLKAKVFDILSNLLKQFLRNAFKKWLTGEHEKVDLSRDVSISVGGIMLSRAKELREDVQKQLRDAIAEVTSIKRKLDVDMLPMKQHNAITKSAYFSHMEEGMDPGRLDTHGMHYLFEADGMSQENKFDLAAELYETQILFLRSMPKVNVKFLAITYGHKGKMYLRSERFDRAIIEFDRQLSLAKEISDTAELAEAYFGLGNAYLGRSEYVNAIRYLDIGHAQFGILGHLPKQCEAKRALRKCYDKLNRPDLVVSLSEQIDLIENEVSHKLKVMNDKLTNLTDRLTNSNADIEHVIDLERANERIIHIRNEVKAQEEMFAQKEAEIEKHQDKVKEIGEYITAMDKEYNAALKCEEKDMMSYFFNEIQPQVVEIEQLKIGLEANRKKKIDDFAFAEKEDSRMQTELNNIRDTISELNQEYEVEVGDLMKRCQNSKPLRCAAFNPANAAGDEVTGTASGGVENFAAADGNAIHLFDFHNGELLHIFAGDARAVVGDKRRGHTGAVTCLCYDMNQIYSGSLDETIMVWDVPTLSRVRILEGHEGSVVSLAVDGPLLCSGGADATIRLWRKATGEQLAILQGHTESVLCMELGTNWLLTGSQDEEARLWTIEWKSKVTLTGKTKQRLIGHDVPVTAVKYGHMEVVTGDRLGRVFIWLVQTGEILRKIEVHKGLVRALQFDATRIVSGAADATICITEIGTGSVVQRLRGHKSQILSIAFDTMRIVSIARDNTLRYWLWGSKETGPPDKFHILDKGETLVDVSKLYKVTIPVLMRWNGISEARLCKAGMQLLVSKGDPSKLTDAEKVLAERARRTASGLSQAKSSMKDVIAARNIVRIEYNRVQKNVIDKDQSTIGNRMFGNDKKVLELFPDSVDISKDPNSLAARLKRNGQAKPHHKRDADDIIFITPDNEEEWGPVADALGKSMLDILVEMEIYELILEQKQYTSAKSITGRIYNPSTQEVKAILEKQRLHMLELRRKNITKAQSFSVDARKQRLEKKRSESFLRSSGSNLGEGSGSGGEHSGLLDRWSSFISVGEEEKEEEEGDEEDVKYVGGTDATAATTAAANISKPRITPMPAIHSQSQSAVSSDRSHNKPELIASGFLPAINQNH